MSDDDPTLCQLLAISLEPAYADVVWQDVLAQVGVAVETVDATHVRLRAGDDEQIVLLRTTPYRVAPSQLPPTPNEPGLLVVASASERTIDAAATRGWHVVTDQGAMSLRLGEHAIRHLRGDDAASSAARRRGPAPWATFTVVRRLMAAPAANQTELATRAGVSQSKVSRVLRRLADSALVEHAEGKWRPSSTAKKVVSQRLNFGGEVDEPPLLSRRVRSELLDALADWYAGIGRPDTGIPSL